MSSHFISLTGDVKKRYIEKIECIRGIDPYTLKDGSEDARDFPSISNMDITQYLLYEKSAYSREEFKNYKSLEAYKNFRSGYLKSLVSFKMNEFCVVRSRVSHSQKVKSKPTDTWVISKSSGEVVCAHCDCVAGLGEVCSHVGSTLFAVEDKVKKYIDGESCTDKAATWKLPSSSLGSMCTVSEISYTEDWDESDVPSESRPSIPEPDEQQIMEFLQGLHEDGEKCAVFSVVEPFCRMKEDSCGLVKCLYKSEYETKSLAELMQIGKRIKLKISDIKAIEHLTKGQHANKKWHELREGRITASLFKLVCRTNLSVPAMSLLKRICYPSTASFTSKRTSYGCEHEKEAIERYTSFMKNSHSGFTISDVGLILHNDYPFLGASPDALIQCDCCGKGVLEVKCPYCAKDGDLLPEITALKASFITTTGSGVHQYSLSRNHAYFYQLQMQMALAEVSFGDFFVWNKEQFFFERVNFDYTFWQENVAKALIYHENIVMPEILGRFFTNQSKTTT